MPLPQPFAYIVCYNLKQEEARYGLFYAALQQSFRWWHFLPSTWIVLSHDTLVDLRAKLIPRIYQGDFLLIMPAKGPADGWLPKEAWDWIGSNVPKEW